MSIVSGVFTRIRSAARFLRTYSQHLPLALEAIFSVACTVQRLEGTLGGSGQRVALLYVGRGRNYSYLRRAILPDCQDVEEVRCNLLTFRKPMARMWESSDVLIGDLSWPYDGLLRRKGGYLEVPDWVDMFIELPQSWDDVIRSFRNTARKNDLRLIRRNQYRSRLTQRRNEIEQFYDNLYLPFVTRRHAADAVIASRKHVIKRAMQGQLLQVMRGSEVVAAGVVHPEQEVLFFLWTGVPPAYIDSPPEAAISALYFFIIRYAFDHGYRFVDFAGTRGFLNDGVFQFKRRWGSQVEDTFSPASILIKPKNGNRNAAAFCSHVPVLARTHDGLGAVLVSMEGRADGDTFVRLGKEFGCGGLDRMTVIEIADESETKSMPGDDEKCEYRLIKSRLGSFGDCYVRAML